MDFWSLCCSVNNGDVCLQSNTISTSNSRKGYDKFVSYSNFIMEVNNYRRKRRKGLWRKLWMKMMKERKRIFDDHNRTTKTRTTSSVIRSSSKSTSMRFSYDPYNYAQNFDDNSSIYHVDVDDNLFRSFSARFASVPSRIFYEKNGILV